MKKIEIYSTPSCHFCHLAKDFFTEHGISFTDYNVAEDADKRREALEISEQMGVPVIVLTTLDEQGQPIEQEVVVGFNQAMISQKLGIAV